MSTPDRKNGDEQSTLLVINTFLSRVRYLDSYFPLLLLLLRRNQGKGPYLEIYITLQMFIKFWCPVSQAIQQDVR